MCAAAFFLQAKMLFPAPPAPERVPAGGERLWLDTPDGVRLAGLHIPPRAPGPPRLVLAFGGNAWSADDAAAYLHDLYPSSDILAFHYRGYPPSGGRARTADLEEDALGVYDYAAARYPRHGIFAVGFSIGSGLAAHLAAHRPVAGAILVTPFDSLTSVAAGQMPWLPVRLLFRNPMEPATALRGSRVPVAILAAADDNLVRPARTDALRKAVPNLVYDRTIPGVGHNEIYRSPLFLKAMDEAMGSMLARPGEE